MKEEKTSEVDLEKQKIDGDLRIRQGELDLKLKELDVKLTEGKKGFWRTSPLILAAVALLGTGIGAATQGYWNTGLERQKFESSLILKSLETTDKKQAANNLLFLVRLACRHFEPCVV
jgi:hypothetical protein